MGTALFGCNSDLELEYHLLREKPWTAREHGPGVTCRLPRIKILSLPLEDADSRKETYQQSTDGSLKGRSSNVFNTLRNSSASLKRIKKKISPVCITV